MHPDLLYPSLGLRVGLRAVSAAVLDPVMEKAYGPR